jgi:hypothetical protein
VKKAIIIAALLCGTAHAEFKDGNKLYSQMTGNTSEELHAVGYVMGVSDAYHGVLHCAPSTVTAGQVTDMVKQHFVANPSTRHYSADTIIGHVLSKAWPCAKKGSGA